MYLFLKTPEELQLEIAGRLKQRRLAQNLTQEGLAKRAGMSVPSLKRFEKTGEISFHSLLHIANTLNCLDEIDTLFQDNPKPTSLFNDEQKLRKRGSIK